jgi:hypothetical protein
MCFADPLSEAFTPLEYSTDNYIDISVAYFVREKEKFLFKDVLDF